MTRQEVRDLKIRKAISAFIGETEPLPAEYLRAWAREIEFYNFGYSNGRTDALEEISNNDSYCKDGECGIGSLIEETKKLKQSPEENEWKPIDRKDNPQNYEKLSHNRGFMIELVEQLRAENEKIHRIGYELGYKTAESDFKNQIAENEAEINDLKWGLKQAYEDAVSDVSKINIEYLKLESELAKLKHDLETTKRCLKDICDEWNEGCEPECHSWGHDDKCKGTNIAEAKKALNEENAKLKEELKLQPLFVAKSYQDEIETLKARLAEAEEVIRFYADSDQWRCKNHGEGSYMQMDESDKGTGEFQISTNDVNDSGVGGKRARTYLEKWSDKK